MGDGDTGVAGLVLGPLLRYVGQTAATIWVETDRASQVEILGHRARTFEVAGHHYALVVVDGLRPGTEYEYQVALDGAVRWPEPDTPFPPSVLRTPDPDRPPRLVFGSCRIAELVPPRSRGRARYERENGTDALAAFARDLPEVPLERWPDVMFLIGDQVYADGAGPATRQFIRERRDPSSPPGYEVADFAEYCALYREAWSEPSVRWLLSVVPTAMIFDDHDVHDDWSTSAAWRRDYETRPWWRARISGAYESVAGDRDHVILATSLPLLLPRGIHAVEAWSEAVCGGAWGKRFARLGERVRRAVDLEHWAAFGTSFGEFERLLVGLATGAHGEPPASITVVSGDIHHSYLAAVDLPAGADARSAVYQAVCSPIHNVMPHSLRRAQRLVTSRPGKLAGRTLARLAGVRRPEIRWRITRGPWFGNMLCVLEFSGRKASVRYERAAPDVDATPRLQPVSETELS